eukprot:TRINITY_DN6266_c0_g1_i1.p1 TRINITY_DN6266_c0_g1~~TRINITY_DN6266_c0_g1_i1.p1  ORF type:complete len:228 (-),score=40.37 TRINITY_DN6266_c0_g1_i1:56-739(-)
MTYIHFINCVVLAFAPSFIVYKATKLSEFGSLTKCLWAGLAYTATQLVKFIFFATFVPSGDGSSFDLVQELIKGLAGLGDLLGIHLVLGVVSGATGDLRILSVGLGWATTESILMRLAQLWIGARSLEFTWSFIQMSLEANINLLLYIALTALVWLWGRKNLDKSSSNVLTGTFVVYALFPVFIDYLKLEVQMDSWNIVALEAVFAVAIAGLAKQLYQQYSTSTKRE